MHTPEPDSCRWRVRMEESMNKLRKIFACLFLVVCAVVIAACGKDSSKKPLNDKGASDESKLITIGYVQSGTGAAWSFANVESIQQSCTEENGINLIYQNAEDDFDRQIEIVRSYIEQKVDLISFTPIVSEGWDEVLKEAKDAGIPVIVMDRMVETQDDTLYNCWIGSNFLLEGYKAADWLIEYMKSLKLDKEEYKVALFQGTIGASAEIGRTQGVEEMLNAEGNYKFVYKDTGDFNHDGGVRNMEKVLEQNLDIDILIAENDDMALGAIEVMEKNGIKPGQDIVIVSFDGINAAFQAMIEGKINCVMECNPLTGKLLANAAKTVMNGDPISKRNYVQEEIFPADTAADYIDNRKY